MAARQMAAVAIIWSNRSGCLVRSTYLFYAAQCLSFHALLMWDWNLKIAHAVHIHLQQPSRVIRAAAFLNRSGEPFTAHRSMRVTEVFFRGAQKDPEARTKKQKLSHSTSQGNGSPCKMMLSNTKPNFKTGCIQHCRWCRDVYTHCVLWLQLTIIVITDSQSQFVYKTADKCKNVIKCFILISQQLIPPQLFNVIYC